MIQTKPDLQVEILLTVTIPQYRRCLN